MDLRGLKLEVSYPSDDSVYLVSASKLVFPDLPDPVAERLQVSGDGDSPQPIRGQLLEPVVSVGFGHPPLASGATVPETAIHEDGDLRIRKDEVRAARQLGCVHSPAPDARPHQCGSQAPLCRAVAFGPHSAHAVTSVCAAKSVHRSHKHNREA